jgi:dynein heavy chain 2
LCRRLFVGDIVPDLGMTMPRDYPSWAPADRVSVYNLLHSTFPALVRKCNFGDSGLWSRWAASSTAERDFPTSVLRDCTPFQRLLIVQTLRPDRLVTAMQGFVSEMLGVQSITPKPVSLQAVVEQEASSTVPVLMITTTGAGVWCMPLP